MTAFAAVTAEQFDAIALLIARQRCYGVSVESGLRSTQSVCTVQRLFLSAFLKSMQGVAIFCRKGYNI